MAAAVAVFAASVSVSTPCPSSSISVIGGNFQLPQSSYKFSGSAKWVNSDGGYIELTPNKGYMAGSAFQKSTSGEWATNSFHISFDVYLGHRDAGADGIAFTVLDSSRPVANIDRKGEGMGSAGLPGYTIEFDTWHNNGHDQLKSRADHVAMWFDGIGHTNGGRHVAQGKRVTDDVMVSNLEDDKWHPVQIEVGRHGEGSVRITVDGVLKTDHVIPKNDLHRIDFVGTYGFTAATGGERNSHRVRRVRLTNACVAKAATDTGSAAFPTQYPTHKKNVCMNADCGCGPQYHAAWCGPQHTNGVWCSVSEHRCTKECDGGVWCGDHDKPSAAAAPHGHDGHGHDGHDHMVEHEAIHEDKKHLEYEKALLDVTKAHLKAEKKIWKASEKVLKAEKKALNAANKDLNVERRQLKKDKQWKEEKGQWKEDKVELKEDRAEWKDAKAEWKGEKDDWKEAKAEFKGEKKQWQADTKEWKAGHKEFHQIDKDAHQEIMAEKKAIRKDINGVNNDLRAKRNEKKFLKKKGLWKEEKAEWREAVQDLRTEKKALQADIGVWKEGHAEWHEEHDSHNHKKKWHGGKKAPNANYWKEGMHDVSGDPFVVDQSGKKVQFFLRTDQEELLLRCGAMQMYGRTMGTDIVGDHQQWFDRMRFVIGNQEQLLVGVNKGATQVGLEQDGIDVIAPNASHKRDSSVGQVVSKPLNILQVMVEGAKMSMTGAVATDSALIAIWSGGPVETVQFSDGNTVIQVKSAIAQKFTGKNEQKLYTHLDLRFMEVKTSECSAGLLAEIWGFAPMSEKTAAMLQPPQ